MSKSSAHVPAHARPTNWFIFGLLGLAFASCSDEKGGIAPTNTAGNAGSSGQGNSGSSGTTSGGSGNAGSPSGGEAGSTAEGGAAGASDGSGGAPPMGGSGGSPTSCIYNDNVSDGGDPGAAGAAGETGIAPGFSVRTSAFGGQHLTDSEGRPLYFFGADIPGDCENAPSVACDTACQVNWFPFSDPATILDPALDPNAFGSTLYMAGDPGQPERVSTYYGWPLYYYARDTLGTGSMPKWSTAGAGVAKLWHLAKVRRPNIVIMRYRIDATTTALYLADGSGMTLYSHANDTAGPEPVSACTGACLDSYAPLSTNSISAVSSLDTSDLSLFVRPDTSTLQVAYKGAPLYLGAADLKPSDRLGVETDVWSLITP